MSRRRRSNPNATPSIHRGLASVRRGNRVFYVAVEGESTEPDYLAHLNQEFGPERHFLIHPLYKRNGMTPSQVVTRAMEYRDEVADGDAQVQLWALFDRDEHQDIPKAMRQAKGGGVRVGFSHPSFDLWLLLHFADFSGRQSGASRIVHEKLRQHRGFEKFGSHNDNKNVKGRRAAMLAGKHSVPPGLAVYGELVAAFGYGTYDAGVA